MAPRAAPPASPVTVTAPVPPVAPSSLPAPQQSASGSFMCGIGGCMRSFRSEPGLNQHRRDSHGVGGQGLDLHGRDSWMLSQQAREKLRNAGVLRLSGPTTSQARRPPANRGNGGPPAAVHVRRHPPRVAPAVQQGRLPPMPMSIPPANTTTNVLSNGGLAEVEQANSLLSQIMRLLIPADIAISHDGSIIYDGIAWKRIGVATQPEVASMFEKLIHLPKMLQSEEYVPPPKTFSDEYIADYSVSDFETLPEPRDGKPGLRVVVLSCSKIVLGNGCEEAVKIAALDVLTGRPLLNHLSCTDAMAAVQNWRTSVTGFSGFHEFEAARQDRFKILKGWKAARIALGKFVDKNTIIVGYNLRSDLDALRIIHGRSIDLVKCVEKAARGPLSKQQLRLDNLARDLPRVQLKPHPTFGRDCLQDAYAIREVVLWSLKQNEKFVQYAKQKSLDYQRVLGV
ncbi:hypothetical protein N0V90_005429 [Kalmusia sp. IMI 367209]|nr:hypothetical protein N0V90_005429 [Kalmusia sp. IMI 367209]